MCEHEPIEAIHQQRSREMSAARLPEGLHTDPVKWTKPKQPRVATEHRRAIKALKAEANRRGQALKPFMRKQALESVSHWFFNKAN